MKEIQLKSIYANPDQPRKEFDKEKLEELAKSIKEHGIIEPLVLCKRGKRYMIIAGERRFRASTLAGLKAVPASVMEADDALVEVLALIENIQRENLNIIEEARGFQGLLDKGLSIEELAKKMGFKQIWRITERTSLLNLTPEYQELVVAGVIGNSQAFEMSRLDVAGQAVVLRKIRAGTLDGYNKVRSFVSALLTIENQEALFELQSLSDGERKSLKGFENMLLSMEKAVKTVYDDRKHMEKAVFHSSITVERMDYLIGHLMEIRKAVFKGEGVKDALQEAV